MSKIISERTLQGLRQGGKFKRGDVVYYKDSYTSRNGKKYGIVVHVEKEKNKTKIWAFWETTKGSQKFGHRDTTQKYGSGWMDEKDCYLVTNREFVKDWKNLPNFFKV